MFYPPAGNQPSKFAPGPGIDRTRCVTAMPDHQLNRVGWQVKLWDPIWQVTLRSSEMGFPLRAAFNYECIDCKCVCCSVDSLPAAAPFAHTAARIKNLVV